MRSYSIFGNIAVVNFLNRNFSQKEKKEFALKILSQNKSVETVVEKVEKFSGRLRKMKIRFVAGKKNTESVYKENGCEFVFDIRETYFSVRLSGERKEISNLIGEDEEVLVCFAGVGPFSIVIAKNSKAKKVYSNEINRKANYYALLNIKKNKLENKVVLLPGDFKKVALKLKSQKKYFDSIVMARPQLKESFLSQAFLLSKKGTNVYYYDFCKKGEQEKVVEKILFEAKKNKKKINILNFKNAGDLSPGKVRIRVDFKVLE